MAAEPSFVSGYNTHRPEDKRAMLQAIGCESIEGLFAAIPDSLRLKRPLDLPPAMNEWTLEAHVRELADKNNTSQTHLNFLGGGFYQHYIPAVINAIASRGEFLTSYTPYQPEISQGLLQALHEYQAALGTITGLPIVNGSCYDGATALADAAWACCMISGKLGTAELLLANTLWPQSRGVVDSYMDGRGVARHTLAFDAKNGQVDLVALDKALAAKKPAGFLFQTPNALGVLEDVKAITEICKKHGAVSVCSLNPMLSGIITPPGLDGADIVVGDGQPLGLPLSAGGPSLGIYATRREYRKFLPGRLIGKVTDINGNLAYALVYEDREQHVARERATSNICSNQALNALRAVIYLSSLGEAGFAKIAALNARKAHYLADKLCAIKDVTLSFTGAYFNEFVVTLPKPVKPVLAALQQEGIFAGIDYSGQFGLKDALLVCVTEVKTKAQMDRYADLLKKALS